jgi:hypothetical protein
MSPRPAVSYSASTTRRRVARRSYVVVGGLARFTLDGADVDAPAITVVAVPDPAVVRAAVALEHGTTVLALGGERREAFRSSWDERHFVSVPRA